MSLEAISEVFEKSRSRGLARLVMLTLADHVNSETGRCWPSVERIAQRTGASERSVRRAFRELQELGELDIEAQVNASNRYTLHPGRSVTPGRSVSPDAMSGEGGRSVRGGVTKQVKTPDVASAKPKEPEENPNRTQTSGVRPSALEVGFEQFWEAYPRKVKKPDGLKAWRQAKAHSHLPAILAAVTAQRGSDQWTRDGGQFIPYPATWLRARQWEDEPARAGGRGTADPARTYALASPAEKAALRVNVRGPQSKPMSERVYNENVF